MNDETTETDIWQPLGRAWWEAAGKQLHASPKQIALAAALERGMYRYQAAIVAGYATDKAHARRAVPKLRCRSG
jgi:hypothetical protein